VSYRGAIITRSRQHYCRPRPEVEALLGRAMELEPQDGGLINKSGQKQDVAVGVPHMTLTPDQWRMLEYLADHPEESVTAVYKGLGFSGRRGAKVREQLQRHGLAVEVETRLVRGTAQPDSWCPPWLDSGR
jgi:hypothetical protein